MSFFRHPINPVNQKVLVLINPARLYHSSRPSKTGSATALNINIDFLRHQALEKYGLSHLNIKWPKSTASGKKVNYIEKTPRSITQMYGESDLSKLPIFQGGFINFGYWEDPFNHKKISLEERIAASRKMYEVIGNLADILREYSLLEVGCGLGYGTTFLSKHYGPELVVGMDISPDQVARAKKQQAFEIASDKLRFTIGEAESMPFVHNSFDRVISIEAAQHFKSIKNFSKEVSRVLKPGGKLVMTSFFPTTKGGVSALNAIVPDYHIHGSQNTVHEVKEELTKCMENVQVSSVGENVWYGFSKWLDQIGYHNQWSKIWCALYEKGLIDYMVYQAEAQKGLTHQKEDTSLLSKRGRY